MLLSRRPGFGLARDVDCSSLLATLDAKLARVNNVKVLRLRQVLGSADFGAMDGLKLRIFSTDCKLAYCKDSQRR